MGDKGDEARKGPTAKRLYTKGMNLSEIAALLDTSVTSLSRWKKKTHDPQKDADEWDLARRGSRGLNEKLSELINARVDSFVCLPPEDVPVSDIRMLMNSYQSLRKQDEEELEIALKMMEGNQQTDIDYPAFFLKVIEWIALKLKEIDPEGLKVLSRNFETLVIEFKAEHAKET